LVSLLRLLLFSRAALVAENLFLRKQLTLFLERKAPHRRTTPVFRLTMRFLARFFDWRSALVIVQPATFIKWHRNAFRHFWRLKSRKRGRPALPQNLREIIRKLDLENPTWGQERIADELLVKLGIRISPRTVRKYLGSPKPNGNRNQRWATFVKNHAKTIVACDFLISVTATFRILYVFVAMEVGSRRILHVNVTHHPTAGWTIQQFRELLADEHPYRFVIHDRDTIFSRSVDLALRDFGIRALRTPVRTPTANAFCERVIGTIRRECLDFIIPINERHLRSTVREFVSYYNRGRPHSSSGPGIPEPIQASAPVAVHRHKLPVGYRISSESILGGLHHDYRREKEAA
jgi:transposase InsO family protein